MLTRWHKFGESLLKLTGLIALALAWEAVGQTALAGSALVPLSKVLAYLFNPYRFASFASAAAATFSTALTGFLIGALLGALCATMGHVFVAMRPGLDRMSSLINAIPQIALAPLFIVYFGGSWTSSCLAALATYFILYVGTVAGLEAPTKTQHEVFLGLGANRWRTLSHLSLLCALPRVVTSLRQAIPVALVGAILGEWFGAERGLGLLMISAMQNSNLPLLWSAILVTMVGSALVYGLFGKIETLVCRRFGVVV